MSPTFVSISSTSCNLARATSLAASSQTMAWSWSRLALRPPTFPPKLLACGLPASARVPVS
eukprot:9503495-Lingulodinium_polyedra.AAC.1